MDIEGGCRFAARFAAGCRASFGTAVRLSPRSGLGTPRPRHSRAHGACETAQSKELAESKATAPLHGACGASAGEGVAPCFGGLGAGEAWGPRGLRPETWAPAPTLRRKHQCCDAV